VRGASRARPGTPAAARRPPPRAARSVHARPPRSACPRRGSARRRGRRGEPGARSPRAPGAAAGGRARWRPRAAGPLDLDDHRALPRGCGHGTRHTLRAPSDVDTRLIGAGAPAALRLTRRGGAAEERSQPQARTGSTRTRHRTRPRSAGTCHRTARAAPRRARSPPARSGGRRDDRSLLLPGPLPIGEDAPTVPPVWGAKGAETRPATSGCVGGCAQVLHRARRAAYAPPPADGLEPASGRVGPPGPGPPHSDAGDGAPPPHGVVLRASAQSMTARIRSTTSFRASALDAQQ